MPQIIETVDVNVPVRQAYDQWTRFEEFPHFLDEVEKIVQVDDKTTDWTVKIAARSASSGPSSRSSTPTSVSPGP